MNLGVTREPLSRAVTRLSAHLGLVGGGAAMGAAADATLAGMGVGGAASTFVRLLEDAHFAHHADMDKFLPGESKRYPQLTRALARLAVHANLVTTGAAAGVMAGGTTASMLTGMGVGGAVSSLTRLGEDVSHAGIREELSKMGKGSRPPALHRAMARFLGHTQAITTGAAVGATMGGSLASTWVGMGVGGATSAVSRLGEDVFHAARAPKPPNP